MGSLDEELEVIGLATYPPTGCAQKPCLQHKIHKTHEGV